MQFVKIVFIMILFYLCVAAFAQDNTVFIVKFVGDMVFPTVISDSSKIFEGVQDSLKADLLMGNLEGPITDNTKSSKDTTQKNVFAFRFPPSVVPTLLKETGFDILQVVNNHSYDYGSIGHKDTIKHLSDAGLLYSGLRNQIVYYPIGDKVIAVISFSYSPTFNNVNEIPHARELVRKAKEKTNIILITMHAGTETKGAEFVHNTMEMHLGEKRGNIFAFTHAMIDEGATAVFGCGPHIVRPVEIYKGKIIFYSSGNFVAAGGLGTIGSKVYCFISTLALNLKDDTIAGASIIPVIFKNRLPYTDSEKGAVKFVQSLTQQFYKEHYNGVQNITIEDDGTIQFLP